MSTIIKNISLCNWFNYAGDYDQNEIPFEAGVNFFCADNNAGKSKLHNAFRWLLNDTIILKKEEVKINKETLPQIVNRQYFNKINSGESFRFGIQVEIEKVQSGNKIRRKILKEINGYRDSSFKETAQIYMPGRGGGWTICDEDFEERSQFIPPAFYQYLFLEGEQINALIPFRGPELRNTINSLTNINNIDELISKSRKISSQADGELTSLVESVNDSNEDIQKSIRNKNTFESEIKSLEESLKPMIAKRDALESKLSKLRAEAQSAKERQEIIRQIEEFDRRIDNKETYIDEKISQYYNLISREFKVSGFLEPNFEASFLNETYRNIILTLQSNRKAELDTEIDKEKQKMVARLIKNQPGIEILKEILQGGKCFVCGTDPISNESRQYIENHLIPHFGGKNDADDNELNLLEATTQMINNAMKSSAAFSENTEAFEEKINEISSARTNLDSIAENKRRYIERNGDFGDSDNPADFLQQFESISSERINIKNDIDTKENQISEKKEDILLCNEKISVKKEGENPKIDKLRKIIDFQNKITARLCKYKENRYQLFCEQLEGFATDRLHQYFGDNPGITDKKFKVSFDNHSDQDYQFKIGVYDKYDNEMNDPGGAETSIRQYCVVLSLLELAKQNNASIGKFPFVVDAPISNLNSEYRFKFYRTLLEENVNIQMIVLTYDLVTAAPESKINEDGKEIYRVMTSDQISNTGLMLFKKDYQTPVIEYNGK